MGDKSFCYEWNGNDPNIYSQSLEWAKGMSVSECLVGALETAILHAATGNFNMP